MPGSVTVATGRPKKTELPQGGLGKTRCSSCDAQIAGIPDPPAWFLAPHPVAPNLVQGFCGQSPQPAQLRPSTTRQPHQQRGKPFSPPTGRTAVSARRAAARAAPKAIFAFTRSNSPQSREEPLRIGHKEKRQHPKMSGVSSRRSRNPSIQSTHHPGKHARHHSRAQKGRHALDSNIGTAEARKLGVAHNRHRNNGEAHSVHQHVLSGHDIPPASRQARRLNMSPTSVPLWLSARRARKSAARTKQQPTHTGQGGLQGRRRAKK